MSADQTTTDVTVVGLGRMGAALAKALLSGGVSTTVWNRDRSKIAPLQELGARSAGTLADAVAASPLTLVCIHSYEHWSSHVEDLPDGLLEGRLVVQLSTGAADDATALRAFHARKGAHSLDGAILAFPSAVGTPACTIYLSGAESAFVEAAKILHPLGKLKHLGEEIHFANALDAAVLLFYFGSLTSFVQASALLESAGLPVDMLSTHADGVSLSLSHAAKTIAPTFVSGAYQGTEVTLETMHGVWSTLNGFATRRGLPNSLLLAFQQMSERALAAGHGGAEFGAMIEAFRVSDCSNGQRSAQ